MSAVAAEFSAAASTVAQKPESNSRCELQHVDHLIHFSSRPAALPAETRLRAVLAAHGRAPVAARKLPLAASKKRCVFLFLINEGAEDGEGGEVAGRVLICCLPRHMLR